MCIRDRPTIPKIVSRPRKLSKISSVKAITSISNLKSSLKKSAKKLSRGFELKSKELSSGLRDPFSKITPSKAPPYRSPLKLPPSRLLPIQKKVIRYGERARKRPTKYKQPIAYTPSLTAGIFKLARKVTKLPSPKVTPFKLRAIPLLAKPKKVKRKVKKEEKRRKKTVKKKKKKK